MLKTIILATAVLGATVAIANAQPLKPIEASTIDLGETHGYAYYVAEAKGYHVIATIETGATPVRFATTLADGQSASVSVPASYGEKPIEITFVRNADRLEVLRAAPFDAVTASTR
ncbi:hypothetical protein [Beijerinckia sp. L45]|uniref:hypothetical protein n=1 Tax=Beijerinckia sp. L45 TaxID=1641855 RepID=UPI00131B9CAE|nr:hypothetical protein [Beijerinckia sp. L45]